jgi:hypothetical protein
MAKYNVKSLKEVFCQSFLCKITSRATDGTSTLTAAKGSSKKRTQQLEEEDEEDIINISFVLLGRKEKEKLPPTLNLTTIIMRKLLRQRQKKSPDFILIYSTRKYSCMMFVSYCYYTRGTLLIILSHFKSSEYDLLDCKNSSIFSNMSI